MREKDTKISVCLFFPERESRRSYTLPAVYTLMTWQVRRRRALFVRGHPVRDASEKVPEIKESRIIFGKVDFEQPINVCRSERKRIRKRERLGNLFREERKRWFEVPKT